MTTEEIPIPNFAEVSDGIFRGGQPTDAGWNKLKELGIIRVIKLNENYEGSDIAAEALGMELISHPISVPQQLLTEPDLDDVKAAVAAIQKNTFVHCEHGQDRTGLVIGCFRVWSQGWNKEDAWNEMIMNGFHDGLLIGLTRFWDNRVNVDYLAK